MYSIERAQLDELVGFLQQNGVGSQAGWSPLWIDGPVAATRSPRGKMIGAARLYRYWLHPARLRLALYVEPGSRRQGIGTALLIAVVDQLPASDQRPLQAAVTASNQSATGFLDHRGFERLMTTRLGTLDPSRVPASLLEKCRHTRQALQQRGIHIDTVAHRPAIFDQAVRLHERLYRDQHAWNPPIELTTEQARELFMDADELDPAMQFLALVDGRLCGVASLRTTDDAEEFDFGWIGTVGIPPQLRNLLHRALIGMCVAAAEDRNALISFEVDQVNSDATAVVNELPVEWGDDWLTFSRD